MNSGFQEHVRDLAYATAGIPRTLSVAPNYLCFVWSDSARSYDKTDRRPNVKGSTDGPQQCGSATLKPRPPQKPVTPQRFPAKPGQHSQDGTPKSSPVENFLDR